MNEKLLQFIWQFQYFNKSELRTTKGEDIQVQYAGLHNTDQGPDFADARIVIDKTAWAGSVEVHINSSDWHRHSHQLDLRYNNVILHVVWEDDCKGPEDIAVLELKSRVSKTLLKKYEKLMNSRSFIPCEKSISGIKPITMQNWKDRLLAERLLRKVKLTETFLEQTNQHWEEIFWWMLARNFGMKINADAFEQLARTLPVTLLAKHKSNKLQIEALLMGQAGLLNREFREEYPKLLQKEYGFLKKKYRLNGITLPLNFLRTRPGNFPTIRLAQLSMLIHHSVHLFSKIKEASSLKEIKDWFKGSANEYWNDHYCFDEISVYKRKKTGSAFIDNIIINTVVPVVFAYGESIDEVKYKDRAIKWLEQLPPEKNAVIVGFSNLGLLNKNAFDSQAFLELKNEYCIKKKCLQCAVGNAILKYAN